jgi:serine protease Do
MVPGYVSMPVFDGAHQIGEMIYNTTLVSVDRGRDLALVQIIIKDIPNTTFSPIACLNPVRGETIYVVGNPFGALFATVGVGVVSSVARDYNTLGWVDGVVKRGTETLMQISAGVISGNSGGSVYNTRGELIGVPVVAATNYESIGFAVSLEDIKEFLQGTPAKSLLDRCSKEPITG